MSFYNHFDALPSEVKKKSDHNKEGEIRETARLAETFPAFKNSSVYEECHRLASSIFGTDARYGHDEAIFKAPGSDPVDWHQDQSYSKLDKDKQCVSIWIPMQPTGPANGGMEYVVSGSQSLLQHKKVAPGSFMYHLDKQHVEKLETVSPVMEPGDVCVHTPLCVHRSYPNTTGAVRVAWILQFNKYGARRFIRWNNLKQYIPRLN